MKKIILVFIPVFLFACRQANGKSSPIGASTASPQALLSPTPDEWQIFTIPDSNLSINYPADWYVHDGLKALQITPNAQPTWSSFFDPDLPHGGPTFDLLHNLNRQMGETPLAEVENLLGSYEAEVEAIEPATPLIYRPDVVVGVYRFTAAADDMVLLLGAAPNPVADSPQLVIALTAVVKQAELDVMQPIFEAILRSIRPADAPPLLNSE